MQHPTRFILNPADSHHRLGVAWQRCQRECLRRLQPSEVTIVESAPEAAQEAWQAAMDGTVRIIVVGSAATANGVVNGLMRLAPSHRRLVRLGFLAPLRPTEWGRTTGFPRRLSRQLEVLHDAEVLPFDLGRMTPGLGQAAGAPHYFLNISHGPWYRTPSSSSMRARARWSKRNLPREEQTWRMASPQWPPFRPKASRISLVMPKLAPFRK